MSSLILIAENDCARRGLLVEWLEDAGYSCAAAATDEALVEAEVCRPDAILIGVDALRGDPMRVAHTLATGDESAPVIVVAHPDLELAIAASRLGAIDCLPWPTSERGVVDTVDRAIGFRASAAKTLKTDRTLCQALADGIEELNASATEVRPEAAEAHLLSVLKRRLPDTYQHAVRVAGAATALARAMRVSPEHINDIRRAALLHDIGKLAIPEELIERRSRLSEEEKAILRTHVTAGAAALELIPGLAVVAALVGTTHERHDGSGYPSRARGVDIPLGARIIAVADIHDALTSTRPYRHPLTHDDANIELARVAGTQLDPDVVRVWIHMTESLTCF